MTNYCVFDLETSIYESFGRKANPFDPRNYIVAAGALYKDGTQSLNHINDGSVLAADWLDGVDLLIGHNFKFDLLYIWGNTYFREWLRKGGRIYDTLYAEYLLTGQLSRHGNGGTTSGLSLDDCSRKYGGTLKDDKIKAYWEQGIQTIDIPQHELMEYLEDDLLNTQTVFLAQVKQAKQLGMVNSIAAHMEGLLCTIEMEYNGLVLNVETGERHLTELLKDIAAINTELDQYIPEIPPELIWNWGSSVHVSALLFGGEIKYRKKMPILDEAGNQVYTKKKATGYKLESGGIITEDQFNQLEDKSLVATVKTGKKAGQYITKQIDVEGDAKEKYCDVFHTVKGFTEPQEKWKTKTDGVYQTTAKVKTELAAKGIPVAKLLHTLSKLDKLQGFYRYKDKEGIEKGLLTHIQHDGKVHHNLNTTATVTGRLSSSDPNMQQCFDGETELLTAEGFIPFKQFVEMEVTPHVAQFNLKRDMLQWVRPKRIINQNYFGPIVEYQSDNIDFVGTSDHTLIVKRTGGYGRMKAHMIFKNPERMYQYRWVIMREQTDGTYKPVVAETLCDATHKRQYVGSMQVYCVTVQSGAIVVRRNGKTYICGNCPRSDTGKVREMFVSRYGEEGVIGDADFSQLEIVGQSELSGDTNLRNDVINRVDMHCMRLAAKLGESYESVLRKCKDENHPEHARYKSMRTDVKRFSFQRSYGASVATIAADTGMLLSDVQAFADAENSLYPAIAQYNDLNMQDIKKSCAISGITHNGQRVGFLQSITGKRYSFVEEESPDWLVDKQLAENRRRRARNQRELPITRTAIMPTQVKNYPVQGFCGELMMNVLGVLFRDFLNKNNYGGKAVLINTVHDCVWVDGHNSVIDDVMKRVLYIMHNADKILERRYGFKLNVPYYAEGEYGKNLYDTKHFKYG